MKCRYLREMPCSVPGMRPNDTWRVGDEIEAPDAYLLVMMGVAEPADDECRAKANMTPEQMEKAQFAYGRTAAGIIPEDFQAYEDGLMIGYKPNGDWIKGPNFEEAEWQQRKDDSPIIIVEDE